MRTWDYSELSHEASLAGGPKALLEQHYQRGYSAGAKARVPGEIVGLIISSIVGYGVRFLVERYLSKLREPQIEEEDVRILERAIEEEKQEKDAPSLEELSARLETLKQSDKSETEMDTIIQYVELFGLHEEDKSVIRIVKEQPDYPNYASCFLEVEPEATELDVVRSYIDWVKPFEGEDIYR